MTSENVTDLKSVESAEAVSAKAVDDQLIDELVHRAQAEGLQLTGKGGLLQQLTKRLLESALKGEITDHLGHDSLRATAAPLLARSVSRGSRAVRGHVGDSDLWRGR